MGMKMGMLTCFVLFFFKENQPIRHVLIKNWLFLRYSLHILFFFKVLFNVLPQHRFSVSN